MSILRITRILQLSPIGTLYNSRLSETTTEASNTASPRHYDKPLFLDTRNFAVTRYPVLGSIFLLFEENRSAIGYKPSDTGSQAGSWLELSILKPLSRD